MKNVLLFAVTEDSFSGLRERLCMDFSNTLRNPEKGTAIAFNGAVVEKFLFQSNYMNVHLKVFTTSMKRAWPTNYLPRMF